MKRSSQRLCQVQALSSELTAQVWKDQVWNRGCFNGTDTSSHRRSKEEGPLAWPLRCQGGNSGAWPWGWVRGRRLGGAGEERGKEKVPGSTGVRAGARCVLTVVSTPCGLDWGLDWSGAKCGRRPVGMVFSSARPVRLEFYSVVQQWYYTSNGNGLCSEKVAWWVVVPRATELLTDSGPSTQAPMSVVAKVDVKGEINRLLFGCRN